MAAMMDADVTTVCGPKGKQDPDRTAIWARYGERLGHPRRPPNADRPSADARHGLFEVGAWADASAANARN
jgi:hypothetical protein